jgi:HK97 gp10 family phage protein
MSVKASWNGDKAKKSIHAASIDAAQKVLLYAEGQAKKDCPVDTGRLRSSITHGITDIKGDVIIGQVGTNVEYAEHVEFGTSKMQAQPYLRPAVDKALNKAPAIFEAELKKVL